VRILRQAYDVAMSKGLYDRVPVHGPQGVGGPMRAYACTNCMEFFAELSVAYHWCIDENTEYNKWFPFNRAQLQKHDPDTYQVIDKVWRQFGSDEAHDSVQGILDEIVGQIDCLHESFEDCVHGILAEIVEKIDCVNEAVEGGVENILAEVIDRAANTGDERGK
jgi:hypothetical protein